MPKIETAEAKEVPLLKMVISADIPVIAFASILRTADELLKCFDYWQALRKGSKPL